MRRDRGFSLLEILVALTLFTIAISSILALYGVAAHAHRRAMQQANARIVATRVASEIRARPPTNINARPQPQTAPDFNGFYQYEVEYESVTADTLRASVRIFWETERGVEEVTFTLLVPRSAPR